MSRSGQAEGRAARRFARALIAGGERGAALVPGKPDESLLLRVLAHDGEVKMPPKSKLPAAEIAALDGVGAVGRAVARLRADDRAPENRRARLHARRESVLGVPAGQAPAGAEEPPRNPIDAFLLAKLSDNGLSFAAPADRRTLVRRLTFDLTGLPPTPAEVDAFLSDDVAEGVRETGRSVARVARVRREVGPPLARRGPLRRLQRDGREPRLRQRLALPRLGHQELQRRQALRPVRPRADRRRSNRRRNRRRARRPLDRDRVPRDRAEDARRGRPGQDADGHHRRATRHARSGVHGPHARLRPLPRPQVRPDHRERLLRPRGHASTRPRRCGTTRWWPRGTSARSARRSRSRRWLRTRRPWPRRGPNSRPHKVPRWRLSPDSPWRR